MDVLDRCQPHIVWIRLYNNLATNGFVILTALKVKLLLSQNYITASCISEVFFQCFTLCSHFRTSVNY